MLASYCRKTGAVKLFCRLGLILSLCQSTHAFSVSKQAVSAHSKKSFTEQGSSVAGRQHVTHEPKVNRSKEHYARGEGFTLPQGVWRTQVVNKIYSAKSGFTEGGDALDLGFRAEIGVSAFALEYGVTDRFTMQVMVPYVRRNSLSLDGNKFRQSNLYQEERRKSVEQIASRLKSEKLCSSDEDCYALIDEGHFHAPLNLSYTLDTGEEIILNNQVDIDVVIDSLIIGAVTPAEGKSGLGDVEVGGLYNLVRTDSWLFSAGVGLRVPTSEFHEFTTTSAYRGTGKGLYSLGTRFNLDHLVTQGLWLSWQEQLEMSLSGSVKRRSSLVDNRFFNKARPKNQIRNRQVYREQGLYRKGFLRANFGAGVMSPYMKPWVAHMSYSYAYGPESYLDGVVVTKPFESKALGFGVSYQALFGKLPVAFEGSFERPVAGKKHESQSRDCFACYQILFEILDGNLWSA